MAGTGIQKYPDASTAYFYQAGYGGDVQEVNVVVLHTTEGRTLPTYGGGVSAPNLTAVPAFEAKTLTWYQHFDIDRSSRALVNLSGGVQTNTNNVCQVELVGTCDPATHAKWERAGYAHIYWPEAPDWALRELAVFLRWMNANHGVPLSGPKEWPAYPSSYGATSARMTGAEWNAFKGICGHLHVTENDHGDPGDIDFPKLLAYAKGSTVPEEDDMPTAAEVAAEVVKQLLAGDALTREVWLTDNVVKNPNPETAATNAFIAPATGLNNIEAVVRRTEKALAALPTVDLSDADVAALAAAVTSSSAFAEEIAERVAVKLAERLAE